MDEFYVKLGITFLLSGLIFLVMMRMQARKEEEARRKFELMMKSRGLSIDVEEKNK